MTSTTASGYIRCPSCEYIIIPQGILGEIQGSAVAEVECPRCLAKLQVMAVVQYSAKVEDSDSQKKSALSDSAEKGANEKQPLVY